MGNLFIWMGGQHISIHRTRKIPDSAISDEMLTIISDSIISAASEEIAAFNIRFTNGKKGRAKKDMPKSYWARVFPSYQWDLFPVERAYDGVRLGYSICHMSQWDSGIDRAVDLSSFWKDNLPNNIPLLDTLDGFLSSLGFDGNTSVPEKAEGQNLSNPYWKEMKYPYPQWYRRDTFFLSSKKPEPARRDWPKTNK